MAELSKSQTDDEDMPVEIDFSDGVRGKFYRLGAKIKLPIHSGDDVPGNDAESSNK